MKQIIKKRTGKEEKKEKRYSRAKNMEKQSFELKRKREPSNDIDGPNRLVDSRAEIEAEIGMEARYIWIRMLLSRVRLFVKEKIIKRSGKEEKERVIREASVHYRPVINQ